MLGLGLSVNKTSKTNAFVGPLDGITAPWMALSLTKVLSTYSGACIRVRRSSDNTEQDINFLANGLLDTASLLSFVGAGDGFVKTWYDQSGNSRNFTNATTSQQPKIVSSGVVVTNNSMSNAILFDSNDRLICGTSTIGANLFCMATKVQLPASVAGSFIGVMNVNNSNASAVGSLVVLNDGSNRYEVNRYRYSTNGTATRAVEQKVVCNTFTATLVERIRINGVAVGTGVRTNGASPNTDIAVGYVGAYFLNGYMSSAFVFDYDISLNITQIEAAL